jgi:hypothetical protein
MDSSVRAELDSIISELSIIINELDTVSSGVRKDFRNIGNERCAASIDSLSTKYRWVRSKLRSIN